MTSRLEYRRGVRDAYADVFTPAACAALEALAPFNRERLAVMSARIARRARRARREAERQPEDRPPAHRSTTTRVSG